MKALLYLTSGLILYGLWHGFDGPITLGAVLWVLVAPAVVLAALVGVLVCLYGRFRRSFAAGFRRGFNKHRRP